MVSKIWLFLVVTLSVFSVIYWISMSLVMNSRLNAIMTSIEAKADKTSLAQYDDAKKKTDLMWADAVERETREIENNANITDLERGYLTE